MAEIPLSAIIRHHMQRKSPQAVALVHADGSLTWAELEARANQRTHRYRELGVAAGDFVTIALANGSALYECSFAIWKLGAIPNLVSPKLPAVEAAAILDLVRPSLIIADSGEWPGSFRHTRSDIEWGVYGSEPIAGSAPARHWKAMTSGGSTGRPKVIVDHAPALYDPTVALLDLPLDGVVLNPGPLYHNAPFNLTHKALFTGNTVIGMSRFDAEEALRLIDRYRVEWVNFVPAMMHRIFSLPEPVKRRYDLSSLKSVWHMAAPMPSWLKQEWIQWLGADRIWEGYGGTETQGFTAIGGRDWLQHRGSVGKLLTPGQMNVFRDDGVPCSLGEIGEIRFLPPSGTEPTYHYIGGESRCDAHGWDTLGDLGWLDAEGFLYIADRRSDLIVRGGANIYPAEVELALEAHPGIVSAAVVGLRHEELGRTVHAIVHAHAGSTLAPADLDHFLRRRLAPYKLPQSYEFSAMPLRDEAGKLRRQMLRDQRDEWMETGIDFRRSPTTSDGS
jgi:bile acid-coenzyme A ligase